MKDKAQGKEIEGGREGGREKGNRNCWNGPVQKWQDASVDSQSVQGFGDKHIRFQSEKAKNPCFGVSVFFCSKIVATRSKVLNSFID